MIEIYQNLFVGSEDDYERTVKYQQGWRIVHACKEPYHRFALNYSGRAAPKTHPEYLIARRGHRLILNLVDVHDPAFICNEIIDASLEFIRVGLADGQRVLVHCNQGGSRAPSIGLLYLIAHTDALVTGTPDDARVAFSRIYPMYAPAAGIWGFIRHNFSTYWAYRQQIGKSLG